MHRYKATIAYDGTDYVGFQIQQNGNSIQAELEKALAIMSKTQHIRVIASGRTDSGVHALGQVIHFDYPHLIPASNVQRALNSLLPTDIRIVAIEQIASTFHARYHTSGKQYIYRVSTGAYQSPFDKRFALHHPYKLDIAIMQSALNSILGTHDFTSFCSTKTDKENKVRQVTRADITAISPDELQFTFEGDGFLYNMVRILVGTTLQIGNHLKPADELARLLDVKNRNQAGPTAAAHGLYLAKVFYKPEHLWFQTYAENKQL